MKYSTLIEDMITEGASPEMILVAVRAVERQETDALERRRAADRARQDRHRLSRDKTLGNVSHGLSRSHARVEDKTSNLEIEPQKEEKEETRERAFDAFWSIYPHKVGKADASKAFARAERRVDLETLMAGLRRYVAKTDDRPWCNPSTWLNQDRWTDEPAAPMARAGPAPRQNPVLASAMRLKEQLDAVTTSEIEGHHPSPRLVAIGGRGG